MDYRKDSRVLYRRLTMKIDKVKVYTGKPCKKCESKERYISTGGCVTCAKKQAMTRCMKYPEKVKLQKQQYYKNNIDRQAGYKLLSTYGVTLDQYNEKLKTQNNVCAVCLKECSSGRKLSVDHNHETGQIRGLLCLNCNRAIGNLKDNLNIINNMANYLKQYERI